MTYKIIDGFFVKTDDNIPYGHTYPTLNELDDAVSQIDSDKWSYQVRVQILATVIVRWPSKYDDKPKRKKKKTRIVAYITHIPDILDIDTVHSDPLPPHKPDGYWSGYKGEGEIDLSEYAEDDDIPALAQEYAEYPVNIMTNNGLMRDIQNEDELSRYIRNVAVIGLINEDGDNYIRYILLNGHVKRSADYVGMLVCRCGDCGKRAQGIFRGNPDMGDWMYQILHRKNWFCTKFGWTYMGGHGYSGGRRMICPSCSEVYRERSNGRVRWWLSRQITLHKNKEIVINVEKTVYTITKGSHSFRLFKDDNGMWYAEIDHKFMSFTDDEIIDMVWNVQDTMDGGERCSDF